MTMRATRIVIDVDTGQVSRIYKSGKQSPAGWKDRRGYIYLSVNNRTRPAHQLVWEFVNGPVPHGYEIDHIDGNPSNNALVNLRLLTHSQNMQNRHSPSGKNKTSGVKGVHWDASRQRWRTHIVVNRKQVHIGRFTTIRDALKAYRAAAAIHHTHNPHAKGDSDE
jgi:HNH endonuclease/AP2 domain